MITENNSINYKLEVLVLKEIQCVSIQFQILRIFVTYVRCVQWSTILNNLLDNSIVDGINLDSVNIESSNSGLQNNGELKLEPYKGGVKYVSSSSIPCFISLSAPVREYGKYAYKKNRICSKLVNIIDEERSALFSVFFDIFFF